MNNLCCILHMRRKIITLLGFPPVAEIICSPTLKTCRNFYSRSFSLVTLSTSNAFPIHADSEKCLTVHKVPSSKVSNFVSGIMFRRRQLVQVLPDRQSNKKYSASLTTIFAAFSTAFSPVGCENFCR